MDEDMKKGPFHLPRNESYPTAPHQIAPLCMNEHKYREQNVPGSRRDHLHDPR